MKNVCGEIYIIIDNVPPEIGFGVLARNTGVAQIQLNKLNPTQTSLISDLSKGQLQQHSDLFYEKLNIQLRSAKVSEIVYQEITVLTEELLVQLRNIMLPNTPIRDYTVKEAGHVILLTVKRNTETNFEFGIQTLTTHRHEPKPPTNLLFLQDTKIPHTDFSGATTGLHGKASIYEGTAEQMLLVIKLFTNAEKSREKLLPKTEKLYELCKTMQRRADGYIQELIQNKKVKPYSDIFKVNQLTQEQAYTNLEIFFKDLSKFKPRTDKLVSRLHRELSTIKVNDNFRTLLEVKYADFIFLRKAYTLNEYKLVLDQLKIDATKEISREYYLLNEHTQAEKRQIEDNIIHVISGIQNNVKHTTIWE